MKANRKAAIVRCLGKIISMTQSRPFKVAQKALIFTGLAAACADAAFATTIGGIARNINTSIQGVTDTIGALSYAGGVGTGALAAIKFKAHRDNPQQTPLGTPITLLAVSALLIFLPSVLDTGGDTIWGEGGGTSAGVDGSGMRNIH